MRICSEQFTSHEDAPAGNFSSRVRNKKLKWTHLEAFSCCVECSWVRYNVNFDQTLISFQLCLRFSPFFSTKARFVLTLHESCCQWWWYKIFYSRTTNWFHSKQKGRISVREQKFESSWPFSHFQWANHVDNFVVTSFSSSRSSSTVPRASEISSSLLSFKVKVKGWINDEKNAGESCRCCEYISAISTVIKMFERAKRKRKISKEICESIRPFFFLLLDYLIFSHFSPTMMKFVLNIQQMTRLDCLCEESVDFLSISCLLKWRKLENIFLFRKFSLRYLLKK